MAAEFPGKVTVVKGCDFEGNDRSGFDAALRAVKKADVAVLCLGHKGKWSGENCSRSTIGVFLFFYRLNCQHGNMIYNDKFNEFLEAFNSNPFRHHEDKAFRKELIENLTKYCFDHMSLLTATLLLKKKFTIEEVINNYYSNVDVFGYDMF